MKSALLTMLAAAGCLAVALGAGATPHPKLTMTSPALETTLAADYGLGEYRALAQWQSASGATETPMDFGLGAYPTLTSWLQASTALVPVAQATL